jgi:hypothetical protein
VFWPLGGLRRERSISGRSPPKKGAAGPPARNALVVVFSLLLCIYLLTRQSVRDETSFGCTLCAAREHPPLGPARQGECVALWKVEIPTVI